MANVTNFGRYVRNLYPEDCRGYTDKEVGKLMREENPELYEEYLASLPQPQFAPLNQQVLALQNQKTDSWAIPDRIRKKRSEANTELINQDVQRAIALNGLRATTVMGVIGTEHMIAEHPKRLKQGSKLADKEYGTVIRQHRISKSKDKTTRQIEKTARQQGLDYSTHIDHKQKQLTTEVEVDKARQLSKVKTEEQREMENIKLDTHREETRIDVIGALVARIPEQFEVEMLTQRLFGYYDKKEMLLLEADTQANRRKMKRLEKNIKELEKAIDGRAKGLIQGNKQRPELGAMEEGE